MIPKPVVSLHGGGESVVLSNRAGRFILAHGVDGLGVAPQELTTAGLASGGSLLRHRRSAEAVVNVPIVLGGDYAQRWEDRRLLERVCDGLVEVRVAEPAGPSRSRFGWYQEGLGGDTSEEFVDGQKLVLSFLCPDPWWFGGEQGNSWALNRIAKPLITDLRVPFLPVFIAPSVVQGAFEFAVSGDAPATPVWTVYPPGEDLLIECENGCGKRLFFEGPVTEPITFDAGAEDITSPSLDRGELWDNVSLDSEFFDLAPGVNRVRISMVGTNAASRVVLSYREKYKAGH